MTRSAHGFHIDQEVLAETLTRPMSISLIHHVRLYAQHGVKDAKGHSQQAENWRFDSMPRQHDLILT